MLVAAPAWAQPQAVPAALSNSDLSVVRIEPDPTAPGGLTTVHAFVSNDGPDTTASTMVVTIGLPRMTRAEKPFFPDGCEVSANERLVRCEFGPGLKATRSATALVPFRLSADLEVGRTLRGWYSVSSPDDRHPSNNRTEFEVKVVEQEPDL
ncbi:hypothetical protein Slala02_13780 [Streptomyces lavendulae subsp. lavendulae]|nr:hypothetical protein Slala01_48020 [Streptomyces lavendulae subsp. lavendulae]GLX25558.1 hypothetical protein Slala02_13780 [Streptomyces lavendulae subsp. lavendulae]